MGGGPLPEILARVVVGREAQVVEILADPGAVGSRRGLAGSAGTGEVDRGLDRLHRPPRRTARGTAERAEQRIEHQAGEARAAEVVEVERRHPPPKVVERERDGHPAEVEGERGEEVEEGELERALPAEAADAGRVEVVGDAVVHHVDQGEHDRDREATAVLGEELGELLLGEALGLEVEHDAGDPDPEERERDHHEGEVVVERDREDPRQQELEEQGGQRDEADPEVGSRHASFLSVLRNHLRSRVAQSIKVKPRRSA